jgi:hypothetical protein
VAHKALTNLPLPSMFDRQVEQEVARALEGITV